MRAASCPGLGGSLDLIGLGAAALRVDLVGHSSVHALQSKVPAYKAVFQPAEIEAEQRQHPGGSIGQVDPVFDIYAFSYSWTCSFSLSQSPKGGLRCG